PAGQSPAVDGLMAVVKADGTFDTSVGNGGIFTIDMGGNSDTLLGSAVVANGTKVAAAGANGHAVTQSTADDVPAVVRLDIPPAGAGPPGADGDDGAQGPAAPARPGGAPDPGGPA